MKGKQSPLSWFVGISVLGNEKLNNLLVSIFSGFIQSCRAISCLTVDVSTCKMGDGVGSKVDLIQWQQRCLVRNKFINHFIYHV